MSTNCNDAVGAKSRRGISPQGGARRALSTKGVITPIFKLDRFDAAKKRLSRKIQQNLHGNLPLMEDWNNRHRAIMYTLTYDGAHYSEEGIAMECGKHFRAFMNRLKITYPSARDMSYFAAAEPGEQNHRWHIHLICNRDFLSYNKIKKCWRQGGVHYDIITDNGGLPVFCKKSNTWEKLTVVRRVLGYVGKYITKKIGKYHEPRNFHRSNRKYKGDWTRPLKGRMVFTSRDWDPYKPPRTSCPAYIYEGGSFLMPGPEVDEKTEITHLKDVFPEMNLDQIEDFSQEFVEMGLERIRMAVVLGWAKAHEQNRTDERSAEYVVHRQQQGASLADAIEEIRDFNIKFGGLRGFRKLCFRKDIKEKVQSGKVALYRVPNPHYVPEVDWDAV